MTAKGVCGGRQTHVPHGAIPWAGLALLLLVTLASAASSYGDVSHEGWPDTVVYKSHPDDEDGIINGTNRSDELLGGHGNDTIDGRNSADVSGATSNPAVSRRSSMIACRVDAVTTSSTRATGQTTSMGVLART